MPDFTRYQTPILAVPCCDCHAAEGAWCKRPSGHRATDLHRRRREAADRAFISQHGSAAEIRYDADMGQWEIENADMGASVAP